jgi:hypothetical protein
MRNSTLLYVGLSSSKDRTTQLCSQRSMKYAVRAIVERNNASHCDSLSCSHFTKGHSCIYACVVKVQGREETTSVQYLGLGECLSWPSLRTSPSSQAGPVHLTQQPRARPRHTTSLIARPDKIITQLLHRCHSLSRLYRLGVMCDEEGLLGLHDDDAFFTL